MKLIVVFLILYSTRAFSCSSCGSGATAPLILWPYENQKLYLGLNRQYGFKNVGSDGSVSESLGPSTKEKVTLSYAHRLTDKAFVSLTLGVGRNTADGQIKQGFSDPLINIRYELVQQSFINPNIPQVQLVLSYLNPQGRAIYDSKDYRQIDVFGTGYHELSTGFDVWFGMWTINIGGSILYTYTHSSDIRGIDSDPGDKLTTVLSSAYVYDGSYKTLVGLISTQQSERQEDSSTIERSAKRQQDLFITFETIQLEPFNIRANYTKNGAFGPEQNSIRATSISIAVMKGFI